MSLRVVVPPNTGRAWEMRAGQLLRIRGTTIADFVMFNRHDLRERFDQARTKANQKKLFVSTGDWLYSKRNRPLMRIVEDGFEGHHDLEEGMCSRSRWELTAARGMLVSTYGRQVTLDDFPDHGCWENLSRALAPYGIDADDVPSPFNVFQHMVIDAETGMMEHSTLRPKPGTVIVLRAEMDLLCAISACPDMSVGGREMVVEVEDA